MVSSENLMLDFPLFESFENLCSDVDMKVGFTFSQMCDTFTVLE